MLENLLQRTKRTSSSSYLLEVEFKLVGVRISSSLSSFSAHRLMICLRSEHYYNQHSNN